MLDSILAQDYRSFEVVICEDKSPQRGEIRSIVEEYVSLHPGRIKYFENATNLGYDGNLRNLIEKASGDYCFFMGNDDLMCPKALSRVAAALDKYENVGVVLRSYAAFDGTPDNITQTFRYFQDEVFFPASQETAVTFYRRSVVIPGMVLHRAESVRYATSKFDGTLLYQLYLVANILQGMNGVSLPQVLVLYRNGGIPDFGNSKNEKGNFVPGEQTPESSLHFIKGMLDIPASIDRSRGTSIYAGIFRDLGNYSYPLLSIQAKKPINVFFKYAYNLFKLGFWKCPLFYGYFFLLVTFGVKRVDKLIAGVKRRCGGTPLLGNISRGVKS